MANHRALFNIFLCIQTTAGIVTRSKAKLAPDQWTLMPLPAKVYFEGPFCFNRSKCMSDWKIRLAYWKNRYLMKVAFWSSPLLWCDLFTCNIGPIRKNIGKKKKEERFTNGEVADPRIGTLLLMLQPPNRKLSIEIEEKLVQTNVQAFLVRVSCACMHNAKEIAS